MSSSPPGGRYFSDEERSVVATALDGCVPGSSALGAVDYVERLLTAMDHNPPHLWAAPAGTGRRWIEVGPWERQAWSARIEGFRACYARVIDGATTEEDRTLVHHHACEATYGDPAYGGNRGGAAWRLVGFPEPMFPPARDER